MIQKLNPSGMSFTIGKTFWIRKLKEKFVRLNRIRHWIKSLTRDVSFIFTFTIIVGKEGRLRKNGLKNKQYFLAYQFMFLI